MQTDPPPSTPPVPSPLLCGLQKAASALKTAGAREDLVSYGPPSEWSGAVAGFLGPERARAARAEWTALPPIERERVRLRFAESMRLIRASSQRGPARPALPDVRALPPKLAAAPGAPMRPTTPPSPSGKPYWTVKEVQDHVMAGPVTADYWRGEVGELMDEVRKGDLKGMRDEWGDVSLLGQLHLHGRGVPLVGRLPVTELTGANSMRKFIDRLEVWKSIFARHGVPFKNAYLIGGGNYAKLKKVKAALALAGVPDGKVDTKWLRGAGLVTEA